MLRKQGMERRLNRRNRGVNSRVFDVSMGINKNHSCFGFRKLII